MFVQMSVVGTKIPSFTATDTAAMLLFTKASFVLDLPKNVHGSSFMVFRLSTLKVTE